MANNDFVAVQRTVQDAANVIRSDIQRLENELSRLATRTDHNDEVTQLIREMDLRVERMEKEIRRHDPRSEVYLQQLLKEVVDLKARFAVIEKFAQQFSAYLQEKFEADKEDREYRGTV